MKCWSSMTVHRTRLPRWSGDTSLAFLSLAKESGRRELPGISGIRESKGELLAFLDADDLWLPEKLRLQKAAMEEDPALDLVFTHMSQFRAPMDPRGRKRRTVHAVAADLLHARAPNRL